MKKTGIYRCVDKTVSLKSCAPLDVAVPVQLFTSAVYRTSFPYYAKSLTWFPDSILANNDSYLPAERELRDWLHLVSLGDQPAFARLLRACWNKVYNQALTYLKDTDLAREVTQDVFIKIWSAREKLPVLENFSNFLFIVSRNEIISALRRNSGRFTDPTEELAAPQQDPGEQLEYKQSYDRLLKAIDQLPPTRKIVFKMSRLEGRSYEEIGKELGISRNGVKDHIVKALNFLRNRVAQWEKDPLILLLLSPGFILP